MYKRDVVTCEFRLRCGGRSCFVTHPGRSLTWLNGCSDIKYAWWRQQKETFSALLALCAGNSPLAGEFPSQSQWREATMFSLICALKKHWIKQWRRRWFETPAHSLWRHCNGLTVDRPSLWWHLLWWKWFPYYWPFVITSSTKRSINWNGMIIRQRCHTKRKPNADDPKYLLCAYKRWCLQILFLCWCKILILSNNMFIWTKIRVTK